MTISAILCAATVFSSASAANFAEGMRKWNAGKKRTAEMIWRMSGWQEDDYRSQNQLARFYRDEDPIESYVWSYLITVSRMGAGQSELESERRQQMVEDANRRRQTLFNQMSASQRFEAQNRVIYILACRGATGLFVLGRLFEQNEQRDLLGRTRNVDISGLIPSNRMAATFYTLAHQAGLPYAEDQLNSLHYRPPGSDKLEDYAETWMPPFERYPGKGYPGKKYTDHCYQDEETKEALARTDELKLAYIQETLSSLGFYIGRVDGVWGEDTENSIKDFQKHLDMKPVGKLTPELKVQIIQTAAILGIADAQNRLGVMYYKGIGVKRSAKHAHKWFQKAANQNHPAALYHLSIVYGSDLRGVEKDQKLERYYLNRSAYAGFKKTQAEIERRIRASKK